MQHMRQTRTRLGLSLSDLEERTGIDASTLSRYETGKQDPSVPRGFLVARALGVSLEALVGVHHDEDSSSRANGCVKNLPTNENGPVPTASRR